MQLVEQTRVDKHHVRAGKKSADDKLRVVAAVGREKGERRGVLHQYNWWINHRNIPIVVKKRSTLW
jgi:hypothetical protein